MMEGIKPYQEYKKTGQAWVGNVPKHWHVYPNRALFSEVKDSGHSDEEMLSVTITKGIIKQQSLLSDSSKKDSSRQDKSAYKLVCPDDIAYNKMRAWQGAVGVSEFRGIISPAYIVMRLRQHNNFPRYFHYLFRTPQFAKEAERWSYGITSDMWSLRPGHFKMIYVPQPPREEQEAIVKFLNYVNGKIDRAIRAKRRTIALLNEQKQAIIHHAVTRGLDPSVRLKSLDTPLVGQIPEHWELRRLKTISRFVTSGSRGWARYYSDKGSLFLRIGNISTTSIDLKLGKLTFVNPPADAEGERTRVRSDDILLSITAQIGAVGVVPKELGEAFVNQHTALIRLKDGYISRWVAYCLISHFGKDQCQLLTNGGTKIGLTLDDVRCLWVPMPNPTEQAEIVQAIEYRTKIMDTSIAKIESEIQLLQEYRTRLISDVVTGKLDVREAAKNLPAEIITESSDDLIDSDEEEIEEAA